MITQFKIFEKFDSWLISVPVNQLYIEFSIVDELPDIRDDVKEGDVVLAVWWTGSYDCYLVKVEDGEENGMGFSSEEDMTWYGLESAWGVVDPVEYDKLAEQKGVQKLPHRELRDGTLSYEEWEETNKYNL